MLVIEKVLGQGLGQLRFSDARGPEENKTADGTVWIGQPDLERRMALATASIASS